jgi:hypothetical protein
MTAKTAHTLLFAFVLAACVGAKASTPTAHPADEYDHEPNICDLNPGWCVQCGHVGEVACDPQSDEGWLCCVAAGPCVAVETYDADCQGDVGWCSDYYTEKLRNGIEVATCEDGP